MSKNGRGKKRLTPFIYARKRAGRFEIAHVLDLVTVHLKNINQQHYSSVPNKRIGPNKRTGWNFDQNTRVQGKNWQFYL